MQKYKGVKVSHDGISNLEFHVLLSSVDIGTYYFKSIMMKTLGHINDYFDCKYKAILQELYIDDNCLQFLYFTKVIYM